MLVLTRRVDQKVILFNPNTGEKFEVIVADFRSRDGRVRLGFNVPRDWIVDREEVFVERMKREARNSRERQRKDPAGPDVL